MDFWVNHSRQIDTAGYTPTNQNISGTENIYNFPLDIFIPALLLDQSKLPIKYLTSL